MPTTDPSANHHRRRLHRRQLAMLVTSYCEAEDVLNGALKGYDLTLVGANQVAQLEYVRELLPVAKLMVDATVGRDFQIYVDDKFELDGNNSNQLVLWKTDKVLAAPIMVISALKVYDQAVDTASLKIDAEQGVIGFQQGTLERLEIRRVLPRWTRWGNGWAFPADFRNVAITATWGFEAPPADVAKAQELVVAMLVLLTVAGAATAGLRSRRVDEFEEVYDSGGAFSPQLKAWGLKSKMLLDQYRTGHRRF